MPPLAVIAAIGIGSAVAGAVGSSKAAGAQAKAADQAAQLQHQDQQASLAEQQRQFNISQGNLAPFLKTGTQATQQLSQLTGTPGQGLLTPFSEQFQAPTAAQAEQTPGYQFQLQQGLNALQNSAAARGGLLSTGTAKNINDYAQGQAASNYSQTYNRALGEYQQRYNVFEGNQANTFNRLSALSGGGQTAANTLGQLGQATASNVANINEVAGQQQGNSIMNAGAARASGYAGVANSITGGLNTIGQSVLLNQLLGSQYHTTP